MEFELAKCYESNGIIYYDKKLITIIEEWEDKEIDVDIEKFIPKDEKKSSAD